MLHGHYKIRLDVLRAWMLFNGTLHLHGAILVFEPRLHLTEV